MWKIVSLKDDFHQKKILILKLKKEKKTMWEIISLRDNFHIQKKLI